MNNPHQLRRRALAVVFSALAVVQSSLFAQQTDTELVQGAPVTRQMNGTDIHSFRLTLTPGQYARLIVDQRGIDVVVSVLSSNGRQVVEVDTPNGEQGPEVLHLVSEGDGIYRVEVRPLKKEGRGNYDVRLDEVRAATAQDKNLVAANAAFAEANNARAQKHRQEALTKFEEALQLYRAAANRDGEIATLNVLASGYHNVGEKQKSLDRYDQVLRLHRAAGNRQGEAETLHNIGTAYNTPDPNSAPDFNDRQKALDHLFQAIALYRELKAPKREAVALNEIGGIYNALGEKHKALQHLNQALLIQRNAGDQKRIGYTLAFIGAIYKALGEKTTALDYYNQALTPFRAANDRFGEASALTQIAMVHSSSGDTEQALEYFQQALPLQKAAPSGRGWEASTLSQIGAIYQTRGDRPKALEFLNQALQLQKGSNNRSAEALTLTYLGAVYSSSGDWEKASECFNRALLLSRLSFDRNSEANVLFSFARAERSRNNLAVARRHTEQAIELIESLRTSIVSQDWRASYLASKRDYYEFYVDLLMKQHQESPGKGHDAAALQASERARARSLLETLTEARIDIRQGVEPQLLDRERGLQQQLNNKELQRVRLLTGKPTEEQAQAIEKDLNALLTDYNEVRAQIRARSPRYDALMQPEPLALREIQQQVLDEETLLLEYALGHERSYLWVVTPAELKSFELPARAVIETAARRVYDRLTTSNKREGKRAAEMAASELGRIVLGPAAPLLAGKRLLIVSEGALQYVPFGALSIPGEHWPRSYRPLIATNEVISLPSASVLAVLRRETLDRPAAPKTVAVLADAVFQNDDARLVQARQKSDSHTDGGGVQVDGELLRSATESGVINFQRLPFTRQEAEAIAKLAGEATSLKALDFSASRDTVFEAKLDQYRIVHFATHGLLNSRHPELSGIVLSLVDKDGRARDGFLRTHEIYNLKLQADLVVLSACRTALGNEVRGEGLLGLTRGFMYSGTPRVVSSLWDVRDEATSRLMTYFYQKMLREGLRPAAALRAAQLALMKEPRWEAPYFWAGFTLQGEWK